MKNKHKIIFILSVMVFAAAIYFLNNGNADPDGKDHRRLKVESIKGNTGWGYRILDNKTPIIEQLNVPGIAGNKGFVDEASALKTGKLVEKKLQMGIFPPSISARELDSMGIRY